MLTREQRDQWDAEGWLLLKNAVPLELVDGVRDCFGRNVERCLNALKREGTIENTRPDLPFETRFAIAGSRAARFHRSWRNEVADREVFDAHAAEPLAAAIGDITGTDVVGHPVFNARPKLPGQQMTVVPWHQDSGYFGQQSVDSLIPTAWIPLVPVDATNGCLEIIPGSHRFGLLRHVVEEREGGFLEVLDEVVAGKPVVVCPMEPGDALVFHNLTLHRSTPHTTSRTIRWAMDIRYLRDGDDPGAIYWKDPAFKWVIRSATVTPTPFEEWSRQWTT